MTERPDATEGALTASILTGIAGLDSLPHALRLRLAASCDRRTYARAATVAEQGEVTDWIGFVARGALLLRSVGEDGNGHIVGLLLQGDICGRAFDGPLQYSLEAAETTELCLFRRAPFEALSTDWPALEHLVVLNLLDELDAAREWIALLSPHRVARRLAGFLLLLCKRWSSAMHLVRLDDRRLVLHMPLSRRDLAELLGTRTESVSRAFHALAADGLVRLHAPDRIEVLDLDALSAFSGAADTLEGRALDQLRRRLA